MNANVTVADAEFRATAARPVLAPPRPRRRSFWARRKLLLATVFVVLAGSAGGVWFTLHGQKAVAAPATVAVGRGNVQETVLASGTLEASSLVSVGAQVSGTIQTLNVKLGDTVKAGDVIAVIDSLAQENKVKSAQAALDVVNAQKAQEQVNFTQVQKAADRATQLLGAKQLSQADYDTAIAARDTSQAKLQALDAQIQQATLNVQSAQLDLSYTTITAPIDGTVVAVLVDQGQTVNAAQSAPTIVKIANLDTMMIEAQISEADVTRVQPGQKATFTVLGDPTPIAATLLSIDPAPDSIASDTTTSTDTAVYYDGVFQVPNPDHKLRISMTAEVTIVLGEADNVLTVPASVLQGSGATTGGTATVKVYDPATGAVTPQKVSVGLNNRVTAEIMSGLDVGERVVSGTAFAAAGVASAASGTAARANAGAGGLGAAGGFAAGPPPGL